MKTPLIMDWKWLTNKVIEVLCNVAFIATVVVYTIDYSKKLTTTVSEVEEDLEMTWPSLTFCTNQGYKKQGFHYKEAEYLENTFALEDIFANKTLEILKDKTRYKVSEIRSDTNGRCFTVQDLSKAKTLNLDDKSFFLKRNHDLVVIVHYPGDEFFVTRFIFPLPPVILDLQVKTSVDLYSADLHLEKEEINLLSKNGQCRIYQDQDQTYNDCLKDKIIGHLKDEKIPCLTALGQSLQPQTRYFENCDDKDFNVAKEVLEKRQDIMNKILANTSAYGCAKPCQFVSYNANMNFFHKFSNLFCNKSEDLFELFAYFDTLNVKKVQEVLVFGEMELLSSIGGTLGLLLGYSACSILNWLFNMVYGALCQTVLPDRLIGN